MAPTRVPEDQLLVTEQPVPNVDSSGLSYVAPLPQPSFSHTPSSRWNSRFFDCCRSDDSICLLSWFVPCVVYGKTQARMRNPSLEDYKTCNGHCCLYSFLVALGCCYWILPMGSRSNIRKGYNIEGNCFKDCAASYFCQCCVLMQNEREVIHQNTIREPGVGYVAPSAMSLNEIPEA